MAAAERSRGLEVARNRTVLAAQSVSVQTHLPCCVSRPLKTVLWVVLPLIVAAAALSFAFYQWSVERRPGTAERPDGYRAGQVWAILTPPDQPDARVTVLRVDNHERLGTVVHIMLSGVELPNGSRVVEHMPLSLSAMNQTVTKLIRENEPVNADVEGYRQWRRAVDSGKGGVFTEPVALSFQMVQEAYLHPAR